MTDEEQFIYIAKCCKLSMSAKIELIDALTKSALEWEIPSYCGRGCSNQVVKNIIYTAHMAKGLIKLDEIIEEYTSKGIKVLRKTKDSVLFENKEQWQVLHPSSNARGYRGAKIYIDKDISYHTITTLIDSYRGLYGHENAIPRFF